MFISSNLWFKGRIRIQYSGLWIQGSRSNILNFGSTDPDSQLIILDTKHRQEDYVKIIYTNFSSSPWNKPFRLDAVPVPGECIPLLEVNAAYSEVSQPFLPAVFCLLLPHLHQDLPGQVFNKLLKWNISMNQCFGSVLISIQIRIRIQHFRSVGSRYFHDQKKEKKFP